MQNEKRQRVDNNPYGHTGWVIDKAIYPEGHPYNWQVIGELVDLQNATLEDVREFYEKFYGPNNATLVLVGDFETDQAKTMIEKYFGEVKRGEDVPKLTPMRTTLEQTKRLYHEDNFIMRGERLSVSQYIIRSSQGFGSYWRQAHFGPHYGLLCSLWL